MSYDYTVILANAGRKLVSNSQVCDLNAALQGMGFPGFSEAGTLGVYAMDVRNLPLDWIVDTINAIQWEIPEHVQLLHKSEHEFVFSFVELNPLNLPGYAIFQTDDDWSMERYPAPMPSLIETVNDIFTEVNRLTVRSVIASRLDKFDEFEQWMTDKDKKELVSYCKTGLVDENDT